MDGVQVIPDHNAIRGKQEPIHVEPRVMDVLVVLLESTGNVKSRAEILDAVWGVSQGADESLTRAISVIRKAFRDAGLDREVIETVPKRGYLCAANVQSRNVSKSVPQSPARRLVFASGILAVLVATVLLWPGTDEQAPDVNAADAPSIAVLPFEVFSASADDNWLGPALTEELLNQLAQVPGLQVAGRVSSSAMAKQDLTAPQIGEALGVSHVVEGSLRRYEGQWLLTAQLLRAEDGYHHWSKTYETSADDLRSLERELLVDISRTLQVRLGVGVGQERGSGSGADPVAYEYYLRGLSQWINRRGNAERFGALAAYERATVIDPDFVDAWAAIGVVGAHSAGSPLAADREAFVKRTEKAFATALSLDPENLQAHQGLAVWHSSQRIDLNKARTHLQAAMAAAPNALDTHYAAFFHYSLMGDVDQAIDHIDKAVGLDPLNRTMQRVRADYLVLVDRPIEAFAFYNECHAQNCLGEGFVVFATASAMYSEMPGEAARWLPIYEDFNRALAKVPAAEKPRVVEIFPALFATAFGQPDDKEKREAAEALLREERITGSIGVWGPLLAHYLDRELMLSLVEQAYVDGNLFSVSYALSPIYGANPWPRWMLEHERYHAIWSDPEMAELARKLRENNMTAALPTTP